MTFIGRGVYSQGNGPLSRSEKMTGEGHSWPRELHVQSRAGDLGVGHCGVWGALWQRGWT